VTIVVPVVTNDEEVRFDDLSAGRGALVMDATASFWEAGACNSTVYERMKPIGGPKSRDSIAAQMNAESFDGKAWVVGSA
jgi:hypothetical protein